MLVPLFRIDASTRVEHDSDFTPSAKVDRIALPQLGCVDESFVSDAVRRHPPTPADTRTTRRHPQAQARN
ncbi:hypothetical protein RI054_08g43490 [Pseudoscourfieldia marina]